MPFTQPLSPTIVCCSLAHGVDFIDAVAAHALAFYADHGHLGDLSACALVVPNLMLASGLGRAMQVKAGRALLLPAIETMVGSVEPWMAAQPHLPDSRRQMILHAQLRRRAWFDEAALWDVVAELTALFDSLTENAVSLPQNEADLLRQLENAFALQGSAPLAFEARVAATLWQAEAQGVPSRAAARLLAARHWGAQLDGPLLWLAEADPIKPHIDMLNALAERVPVMVVRADRALADSALARCLNAAWPVTEAGPLFARAAAISVPDVTHSASRLQCVTADSLETLAQEVVQRVLAYLSEGKQSIALIACDRLATRRARALLEREGVLVDDETGWKMATTRAAASVDAWLELIASDGWHRALADVLDSPYLFADLSFSVREEAQAQIRQTQADGNILKGVEVLGRALPASARAALGVMQRIQEARRIMAVSREGSVAQWLQRLDSALQALGAREALAGDAAGFAWLEWHALRLNELREDTGMLSFGLWRSWFNREMDVAMFRDHSISSPVCITHLVATRMRRFEAAIVVGADAQQLVVARAPGWLAHAGVRAELGLPGSEVARAQLREDLAGLALSCDELVLSWQRWQGDEAVLPAADVALYLQTMQQASAASAHTLALPWAEADVAYVGQAMPAPRLLAEQVPERVSASGMQHLLACPYRYFARQVLRLGFEDELNEEMEKRHYGEHWHAVLHDFHSQYPRCCDVDRAELETALQGLMEARMAQDLARNFLDHAWLVAARSRLSNYIDWQLEREAAGWFWQAGELQQERNFPLEDGAMMKLHGRIDRVDSRGDGEALLDYKTRKLKALKDQLKDPDDVQLAFYALLHGGEVAQGAYVSLDDDRVAAAEQSDPPAAAEQLAERMGRIFVDLRAGAALPAHGSASACAYCDMQGLCRKSWHLDADAEGAV